MYRLRPLTFFAASNPSGSSEAPFLSALGALAINDRHARAGFAPFLFADRPIECMMDALQRAVPIPQHEVVMHYALPRQVLRQRQSLAPRREHIEDAVERFAHFNNPPSTGRPSRRDHRCGNRPFSVGQIARVTKPTALCGKAMFGLPHRTLLFEQSSRNDDKPLLNELISTLDHRRTILLLWYRRAGDR